MYHFSRTLFVSLLLLTLALVAGCNSSPNTPDGDIDTNVDGDVNTDGDTDGDVDSDKDSPDEEIDEQCECKVRCFSVNYKEIDFGSVQPLTCGYSTLTITSTGQSDIHIYDIRLVNSESSDAFEITEFSEEPELDLLPQHFVDVKIAYCPTTAAKDEGVIRISTDSECSSTENIKLVSSDKGQAILNVGTESLDWGSIVKDGSEHNLAFTMSSEPYPPEATQKLTITGFDIDQTEGKFAVLTVNNCNPPITIEPNESKACSVSFNANGEGDFAATLTITATDNVTQDQVKQIELSARSEFGLLEVDRKTINFGHILVNKGPAEETVKVTNNGTGDVDIQPLSWLENTSNEYSIDETTEEVFDATLLKNSSKDFDITIEPTNTGSYIGRFRVKSEDPYSYNEEVVVSSIAVTECPAGKQPDPGDPVRCITKCDPGENVCGYKLVTIDDQNVGRWGYSKCQSDGVTLGDFVPCTATQVCDDGQCIERPCDPGETACDGIYYQKTCDENGLWNDPVPCITEDDCKPVECRVKTCQEYSADEGTECDDGNKCTENGKCNALGACVSETVNCDLGNTCMEYSCDPTQGCISTPRDDEDCTDNNACTVGDYCLGGNCIPGATKVCDDGKDCTDNKCDPQTGCYYENNDELTCSDGNVCTMGDYCLDGVCQEGPEVNDCDRGNSCETGICQTPGGCIYSFQSGFCDDGDNCTKNDYCATEQGQYVCKPGTKINCVDNNPCTYDLCNADGTCDNSPLEDGALCSDNNMCTGQTGDGMTQDHCESGFCVPGSAVNCEDGNICTTNWCDEDVGCRKINNNEDCTDNNECTVGDMCSNGVCISGGGSLNCDDGKDCTADSCDSEQGCVFTPDDNLSCTDNDLCTVGDHCSNGECIPGTEPYVCPDDDNPCTVSTCEGGTCKVTVRVGEFCDDNKPCTENTVCSQSGVCSGGTPTNCEDGNPCTNNYCVTGLGCQSSDITAAHGNPLCDDGNPCTTEDRCDGGQCIGGNEVSDESCEDGNPCTDNWCDPVLGCTGGNDDTNECSDDDPCSLGDYCSAGTCNSGSETDLCNDNNDCTTDECVAGYGCTNTSRHGESCEDGNLCTIGDTCNNKTCVPGVIDDCDDGKECTDDACYPDTGCINEANDALSCSDQDDCTINDHCEAGECVTEPRNCADTNECTDDYCEDGICKHPYASRSCDDEDPCTSGDWCVAGNCAGNPVNCDDGNVCTTNGCDSEDFSNNCTEDTDCGDGIICENGQCVGMACTTTNNSNSCDDGNWCDDDDYCSGGTCHAGATLKCQGQCYASCDDSTDSCVPVADGTACDDGNNENYDDVCTNGVCAGTDYFTIPGDCPGHSDMIKLLGTRGCIDKWENEICRSNGDDCRGKGTDNYWACFWDNGNTDSCSNIGGGKPKAYSRSDKEPSTNMTYDQAKKACELSGKSLCTATEWGLACTQNDGRTYPWGNTWNDTTKLYCNGSDYGDANGGQQTRNTGTFSNCTNDWGTFDLSGNVSEWTSTLGDTASQRVRMGGNYGSGSNDMTCSKSVSHEWDNVKEYIGFRCCIPAD